MNYDKDLPITYNLNAENIDDIFKSMAEINIFSQ